MSALMRLARGGFAVAFLARLATAEGQAVGTSAPLTLTFFDVGQGDAALVHSPTGKTVLVDAGPSPSGVANRLRAMRVTAIDLVVASHNHADHIGGMSAIIGAVTVRNYLDNEMPATTRTYANVVRALEVRHVPVLRAVPRRVDLGGGASMRVLIGDSTAQTQNDRSIGLLVTYGQFTALFTGDAEGAERVFWRCAVSICEDGPPTDSAPSTVELLKVSHHGSANGTDPDFLRRLRPCAAIISVGSRNKFGHPSRAVLDELRADSVRVYRTDVDGDVTVTASADGTMTIRRQRGGRLVGSSADRLMCPKRSPVGE